jgi:L-Ala-D/L-Glu epimerase / N-acetyl-D-glutamate racemase
VKLSGLEFGFLSIPFKTAFNHAAASRNVAHSLIATARTSCGLAGFGEGCPRDYVTGETGATASNFICAHRSDWLSQLCGVQSIADWAAGHRAAIDANPAAWAAVELALLDICGHASNQSVERLLGLAPLSGIFGYTAVLGDMPPMHFEDKLARYVSLGFRDFKIKLCGERERDLTKVRALLRAGVAPTAVRADANNLWRDADSAIRDLTALDYPFIAVEEPIRVGDFAGLRRLAFALDTKIILDESLLNVDQLKNIDGSDIHWIANLRVSKMGGLLRCLEFIEAARARGLSAIVGAHVGESSLLTRAAMTVAMQAADMLIGQEGAFGTHLLSSDIVAAPIMFGQGGRLDAAVSGAALLPGLGLSVIQPLPYFSNLG